MSRPDNPSIPAKPYGTLAVNLMYDLLFCDDLKLYRDHFTGSLKYPWDVLFADHQTENDMVQITDDPNTESRAKILACHKLRLSGLSIQQKTLYAVIVEVGLEDGLDVLAAFSDGSARYINHSERMVIWETPNEESNALVKELLHQGAEIITRIGPWNQPRKQFPPTGNLRISFLVSDGLYFGEGPIDVLFNDEMAGPALHAATQLLQFLAEK